METKVDSTAEQVERVFPPRNSTRTYTSLSGTVTKLERKLEKSEKRIIELETEVTGLKTMCANQTDEVTKLQKERKNYMSKMSKIRSSNRDLKEREEQESLYAGVLTTLKKLIGKYYLCYSS